jgi:hypothetical protein
MPKLASECSRTFTETNRIFSQKENKQPHYPCADAAARCSLQSVSADGLVQLQLLEVPQSNSKHLLSYLQAQAQTSLTF